MKQYKYFGCVSLCVCVRSCVCDWVVDEVYARVNINTTGIFHAIHITDLRIFPVVKRGIWYFDTRLCLYGKGDVTITIAVSTTLSDIIWAKSTFRRQTLGGLLSLIKNANRELKEKNTTESTATQKQIMFWWWWWWCKIYVS